MDLKVCKTLLDLQGRHRASTYIININKYLCLYNLNLTEKALSFSGLHWKCLQNIHAKTASSNMCLLALALHLNGAVQTLL